MAEELAQGGVGDADRLQRLWTPHRMSYIVGSPDFGGPKRSSEPFSDIPGLPDEEGLVVARGELVYAVLNLYPYNPGHLMVVPYRRVAELEDLTGAETAELMTFTQNSIRVIKSVSHPDGFNVGLNLGRSAGIAGRTSAHACGAEVGGGCQLHHRRRRDEGNPATVARHPHIAG